MVQILFVMVSIVYSQGVCVCVCVCVVARLGRELSSVDALKELKSELLQQKSVSIIRHITFISNLYVTPLFIRHGLYLQFFVCAEFA